MSESLKFKFIGSVIVFNILLLFGRITYAQEPVPLKVSNELKLDNRFTNYIDSCIQEYMKVNKVPGMALALVKDTSTLYAKGYGLIRIDKKDSVTANSAFDMASTTKLFTATAIMQLVEKNQIILDSPVVKYIPYFRIKGDYKKITIRNILSHTSGLPRNMSKKQMSKGRNDPKYLENCIRSLSKLKMIGMPGTETESYSNIGYFVLSEVIAKVSKTSYEEYVKINIFDPLGMSDSRFSNQQIINKVEHHENIKSKVFVVKDDYMNPARNGGGGLYSSADDMSIWIKAFLNNGHYLNYTVLKDSTFKMMLIPQSKTGYTCNGCFSEVGLGWRTAQYNGNKFIGHGGSSWHGGKSLCLFWPKQSVGILLVSNIDDENNGEMTLFIMDKLLEYLNK